MARVIDDQLNVWGKQQGIEAQRTDLWRVDFTTALNGLAAVFSTFNELTTGIDPPFVPPKIASYQVYSVALPDLRIRSDPVRRDSRPFHMPSWDEPCEPCRFSFILDCFKPGAVGVYQSDLYQMLTAWRAAVRAGRGGMSGEFALSLNDNYSIDYAFNIGLDLMRGDQASFVTGSTNDLQFSTRLKLINCWLGSFRLQEMTYEGSRVMQIEAIFYIEDILKA